MRKRVKNKKKEIVAIIGLGYVGLPLACLCAEKGYKVYGLGKDRKKINLINKSISPIADKKTDEWLRQVKIEATADYSVIKKSNIIVVCVPTPVDEQYNPDLKPVISATEGIRKNLRKGHLVIMESTVNPGVCEEVMLPILEKSGLKAGRDFDLAHCPERINPGDPKWNVRNIPRCVGALTKKGCERAVKFYKSILEAEVTPMKSLKEAEATKIIENAFRDINIAFVNELAKSFERLGIDLIDVIKGASTKPFAFMPHWPGVGVGGHCFDGREWVTIRFGYDIQTLTFKQLDHLLQVKAMAETFRAGKVLCRAPRDLQVLSYDLETRKTIFRPVSLFTRQRAASLIELQTDYNVKVRVTPQHPMIVQRDQQVRLQWARDIAVGDQFLLTTNIPSVQKRPTELDLLAILPPAFLAKIRVKLLPQDVKKYGDKLASMLTSTAGKRDYLRDNSIPVKVWLRLEPKLKIKRCRLLLCTGRGPSFSQLRAVLRVDTHFSRLLGYYLSEGCLTNEKKTARLRFTVHPKETQFLADLRHILNRHAIVFSEYRDPKWRAHHVKVSSAILGYVFQHFLQTGTDCYSMRIPQVVMGNAQCRAEVLKGLFRGDGGVQYVTGRRAYVKHGRTYVHRNNSLSVNYFTSSPVLFQQVSLLLLERGIVPNIERRPGLMRISGDENLQRFLGVFVDQKAERLQAYFRNQRKVISYSRFHRETGWITVPVTQSRKIPGENVFSMEVEQTNTLITSNGLIVHNCIPVDPYYLIERAKMSGFDHKFLKLAREINNSMPAYTVEKLQDALNQIKKSVKGTSVGILGLSYKANVGDLRETPSLRVIKLLQELEAKVEIYDPYFPDKSTVKNLDELLKKCYALILITNHQEFVNMDLSKLKKYGIKVLVDGRNCLVKEKIKKLGIIYKGVGR